MDATFQYFDRVLFGTDGDEELTEPTKVESHIRNDVGEHCHKNTILRHGMVGYGDPSLRHGTVWKGGPFQRYGIVA